MADNRTVFLVNTFIAHTILLLNNFAAVCEDKLADVHLGILRLEATTTLLESKLDSVARSRGEAVTMREAAAKGKDMGPRYAGTTDLVRVFNRALELLNSDTPESDQELLDLVRKSKREMDKEQSVPPAKKSRTGRGPSEVGDFQALGHRPNLATLAGDHGSGQSGSGSEGTPSQSTSSASASVAHAQVRPIQIIRNPGRVSGRGEKQKRKQNNR